MALSVTREGAGVAATVVGVRDWSCPVRGHDIDIEIHQALAGYGRGRRSHAMGGVTDGTGETVGDDMRSVAGPTRSQQGQVVALGAEGVGPGGLRTQDWIRVQILTRDRLSGSWSFREGIRSLEDVAVL
jgi:hypothetical protein